MRVLRERLTPSALKIACFVVLAMDVAVTALVWRAVPMLPGRSYVVGGVFILFPIVLVLGIGVPFALVRGYLDARDSVTKER